MWASTAMNLPNALTVTRIFLVPLLVVVLLTQFEGRNVRGLAYARGIVIPASPLGKVKMVSEVVAILALILAHEQTRLADILYWTGQAALWFVVVTALVSAADYFKRFNVTATPRVADMRD